VIPMIRAFADLCLFAVFSPLLLPAIAGQDQPKTFGTPIALGAKTSITVKKENAEEWRSRYPTEFNGSKGALAAFTFHFSAKEIEALSFATNYIDANHSNVKLVCGDRALIPSPPRGPTQIMASPSSENSEPFAAKMVETTQSSRERIIALRSSSICRPSVRIRNNSLSNF